MTRRALFSAVLVALATGCVHAQETRSSSTTTATEPTVTVTEAPPAQEHEQAAAPEPSPATRPRLSKTVTLGQGEATYSDPRAAGSVAPPAPPVVVNNNVVVQQSVVGGYPAYGYGYGGYGGYGRGTRSDARVSTPPTWGSSGWEGPRRTAAPGQTPGVGGNWAPAPSYGPAPMR